MFNEPINFIESRAHSLSPFSAHRIEIWGEVFPTLEHAYQASRIVPSDVREQIKSAKSPLAAWKIGQTVKNDPAFQVPNYDKLAVMEELMRAKLAQHEDVVESLLETGERGLLKIYATDYFWGTGHDGSGENHMGKMWMKLRDELRNL